MTHARRTPTHTQTFHMEYAQTAPTKAAHQILQVIKITIDSPQMNDVTDSQSSLTNAAQGHHRTRSATPLVETLRSSSQVQYSSFIVHQNSIETHGILMHN